MVIWLAGSVWRLHTCVFWPTHKDRLLWRPPLHSVLLGWLANKGVIGPGACGEDVGAAPPLRSLTGRAAESCFQNGRGMLTLNFKQELLGPWNQAGVRACITFSCACSTE